MTLKQLWAKIPTKYQAEMVSIGHTFVAASVVEAGIQYAMYGNALQTESSVLMAILSAVVRSGVKAVLTMLFSQAKAAK